MLKINMNLNSIIKEIKKNTVEGEFFMDCLKAGDKKILKAWANNKTEKYLLTKLNKFTETDKSDYIDYADEKYNMLIDLIDYSI